MWNTPRTWVTSEKVTASLLNLHTRDNLNFLYGPPRCKLTREGGFQTQSSNPVIDWTVTRWDNDSMTNPDDRTKMDVNTAGYYFAVASVYFDIGIIAGSITLLYIVLNGLSVAHSNEYFGSGYNMHSAATGRQMAAASYLQCIATQTALGSDTPLVESSQNAQAGAGQNFLSAVWIGGD